MNTAPYPSPYSDAAGEWQSREQRRNGDCRGQGLLTEGTSAGTAGVESLPDRGGSVLLDYPHA